MKRKIFGFFAIMAIAAMAVWNVNFGSKTNSMSDVMLANVEALAVGEGTTVWSEYSTSEYKGRETFTDKDGWIWNCDAWEKTCHGYGTLKCTGGKYYSDCYTW